MSTVTNTPDNPEGKRSATDAALDRFADMMIEKIEGISNDWKKPWFTEGTMAWPKNLDGREYNGMNALMLTMHCEKEGFKVPVFMTFDRIAGLNYKGGRKTGSSQAVDKDGKPLPQVSVLKGSKSFPVFLTTFTVVNPETHEKISYDDYKHLLEDERSKYKVFPKLNVFNVFNVDQTNLAESRPELYQKLLDNNTISKPIERKEGEMFTIPEVEEMIRSNKWLCPIKPTYGDDAYYSISKDEIVVPQKKQFTDGEAFYGTLFHEMIHSTGAESRLNRLNPSSGFGSHDYAVEELKAELGSALISQRYGIQKYIKEDSAAYLKSWLDSLKESPDYIRTVLTDVKKATSMVIDATEKVEREMKEGADYAQEQTNPVQQGEKEHIAAKGKPSVDEEKAKEQSKYSVYCAGVGRYVSQVANPAVHFADKDNALLFNTKEEAKAVARECKYYMPDERFTVREVKVPVQALDQNQEKAAVQAPLKDLGTYQIPQWALNYMVNGESDGLNDEEITSVDKFVKENFPNGYLMQIDWNETNEFNRFPAFGPRNENALSQRGESPFLATSTVAVQFRDPVLRETEQPTVSSDELGIITHPNREIWQVTLVGAYDTSDLQELRQRARMMNGIPSSEENKFYFMDEANARKFNAVPGAFQSVEEQDARSRLSDLVVEIRGESRQPWLAGKVDGQPVLSVLLQPNEYKDYMSNRTSIEDLALKNFKPYLEQSPEEKQALGMGR